MNNKVIYSSLRLESLGIPPLLPHPSLSPMGGLVWLLLFLTLLPIIYILSKRRGGSSKLLPPGSMGIPVIGHSLGLLNAMKANKAEQWLQHRINKYGPIFKLSLFGKPTIFISGPAANKFIFSNESLALQQPRSIQLILGKKNMMELTGEEHTRVRGAVGQFLRPEVLKQYMKRIDWEVRHHLNANWNNRKDIKVLPLMKRLTFDIICSVIFGLERGSVRDILVKDFEDMLDGMWAVPVNLPFTRLNKSLQASQRARNIIAKIIKEKRAALLNGNCTNSHNDLISYLLLSDFEDKASALTEEEIIDNALLVMTAGHDTTAIVLTFMIRQLAKDPDIYAAVVQEQEEIARSKANGEALVWDDLLKMKYTWRVAMETLRMIPPVFGSFRRVLKDLVFEEYKIPQGWQVFWATHMTQMDRNIFTEPQKFDPSRFGSDSYIPPYCFAAFGGGSRICPGNEFARIEALVTMHYLVIGFEWKLLLKEEDDVFCRDPLPTPTKGLPIKLSPKSRLSNIVLDSD